MDLSHFQLAVWEVLALHTVSCKCQKPTLCVRLIGTEGWFFRILFRNSILRNKCATRRVYYFSKRVSKLIHNASKHFAHSEVRVRVSYALRTLNRHRKLSFGALFRKIVYVTRELRKHLLLLIGRAYRSDVRKSLT